MSKARWRCRHQSNILECDNNATSTNICLFGSAAMHLEGCFVRRALRPLLQGCQGEDEAGLMHACTCMHSSRCWLRCRRRRCRRAPSLSSSLPRREGRREKICCTVVKRFFCTVVVGAVSLGLPTSVTRYFKINFSKMPKNCLKQWFTLSISLSLSFSSSHTHTFLIFFFSLYLSSLSLSL